MVNETLGSLLLKRVREMPRACAFSYIENQTRVKESWVEFKKRVQNISFALLSHGVERGDRVAILSTARYEVALSDMAVAALGAVSIALHPESRPEDLEHILCHSGATFLFVEDGSQLKKIVLINEKLKELKGISLYSRDNYVTHYGTFGRFHKGIIHFRDLSALGEREDRNTDQSFEKMVLEVQESDLYSILYTSGVSGPPKAVPLTFSMALDRVSGFAQVLSLSPGDRTIPVLPFSGGGGRIEFIGALVIGLSCHYLKRVSNWQVAFREVKPTVLLASPLFIEEIYDQLHSAIGRMHPWRRKPIRWALESGRRLQEEGGGGKIVLILRRVLHYFLRRVFFFDIRKFFGGRLRSPVMSGGVIHPEIMQFFRVTGFPIINVYGLAESFFLISTGQSEIDCRGREGNLIGEIALKISDYGEICLRGKGLFAGYMDASGSINDISQEGWFRTGDIGSLKDRFLTVIGRRNACMELPGNHMISPEKLEILFSFNKHINHVLICGRGRPFLTALVTMNEKEAVKYAHGKGVYFSDFRLLCQSEVLRALVSEHIASVNARLEPFEGVREFRILDMDFSIESGELTPQRKLRRNFCLEKFATLIETMYESHQGTVGTI